MRGSHGRAAGSENAGASPSGDDTEARGVQIEEAGIVGKIGDAVRIIGCADTNGGRDAGRVTEAIGKAIVAGSDHGGDVDTAQGIDDGLGGGVLRVAGSHAGVFAAAQAHVDRGDRKGAVQVVDARQAADDVGGIGRNTRRRIGIAVKQGIEPSKYLHPDDAGALGNTGVGGVGGGDDAGDMRAVAAQPGGSKPSNTLADIWVSGTRADLGGKAVGA